VILFLNVVCRRCVLVGTDIQDNKCSWLVVQALEWDDKKVAKIKGLYKDLGLPAIFETYEEDSYKLIQAELAKVKLMPKEVFELLLAKIYKRSK
jgi:farnesyl diphosphate synthase